MRANNMMWHRKTNIRTGGLIATLVVLLVIIGVGFAIRGQIPQGEAEIAPVNDVRINKIMSDNAGAVVTDQGATPDWIEIRNAGTARVNLAKYVLMLESSPDRMFVFPECALEAGECRVIYAVGGNAEIADALNAPFKLPSSGGDTLMLLDARGGSVDKVRLPELRGDDIYMRSDSGEWMLSDVLTDQMDRTAGQKVETALSVVPAGVEITEVMSGNTLYRLGRNADPCDYVELHNVSDAAIDLTGWYLSDSVSELNRWTFPQAVLAPDEYLLICCSGEESEGMCANFRLSSEGECVCLTRPDGQIVVMAELPALKADQAYSFCGGAWTTVLAPTPGLANTAENAQRVNDVLCAQGRPLRISEVLTSAENLGDDWIEIFNSTAQAVDLSGFGLTDDASRPHKWLFPEGTQIQPGEYMGVICSNDARSSKQDFLCADFAIASSGGDTLLLTDSDGGTVDALYLPQQYARISYGRSTDGGKTGYFEESTPGMPNSSCLADRVQQVEFSVSGGTYHAGEAFFVELRAAEGCRIYYTTDCSDPNPSSKLYTAPIQVRDTTVLRAYAVREGALPSFVMTQSYLYDVENPDGVYVISIVSDPVNLYDETRGIMVAGPNATHPQDSKANYMKNWERAAHVEIYTGDGGQAVSQNCGLKLHGLGSRTFDLKPFKLIARDAYGADSFAYPLFSNRDYDRYQSVVLRMSGQDYNETFIRDTTFTELAYDTSLMYMSAEVAVVYLNGEYYSLMYLRERINKYSICRFEGWEGMENEIDIVSGNDTVDQGSNASFAELLEWLKTHDPSTQEAFDRIDARIDVQSYIEVMALEIFIGNGDALNYKRYCNPNTDGKWRWALFDCDWGFTVDTDSIRRWLVPEGMGYGNKGDTSFFIACMSNPVFRDRFVTYFGQQLATTWSTENVRGVIAGRFAKVEHYLGRYLEKISVSTKKYKEEYQALLDYADTRPEKIIGYFRNELSLTDDEVERYFGEAMRVIAAKPAA